ncbi:uncharacterized protein [Excalfactoria chinensis]|uniref:uncharacterized protein n=1 Tax=Excalfactoria chinensis TaxID=46218 RepID=UPI003B3A802E
MTRFGAVWGSASPTGDRRAFAALSLKPTRGSCRASPASGSRHSVAVRPPSRFRREPPLGFPSRSAAPPLSRSIARGSRRRLLYAGIAEAVEALRVWELIVSGASSHSPHGDTAGQERCRGGLTDFTEIRSGDAAAESVLWREFLEGRGNEGSAEERGSSGRSAWVSLPGASVAGRDREAWKWACTHPKGASRLQSFVLAVTGDREEREASGARLQLRGLEDCGVKTIGAAFGKREKDGRQNYRFSLSRQVVESCGPGILKLGQQHSQWNNHHKATEAREPNSRFFSFTSRSVAEHRLRQGGRRGAGERAVGREGRPRESPSG